MLRCIGLACLLYNLIFPLPSLNFSVPFTQHDYTVRTSGWACSQLQLDDLAVVANETELTVASRLLHVTLVCNGDWQLYEEHEHKKDDGTVSVDMTVDQVSILLRWDGGLPVPDELNLVQCLWTSTPANVIFSGYNPEYDLLFDAASLLLADLFNDHAQSTVCDGISIGLDVVITPVLGRWKKTLPPFLASSRRLGPTLTSTVIPPRLGPDSVEFSRSAFIRLAMALVDRAGGPEAVGHNILSFFNLSRAGDRLLIRPASTMQVDPAPIPLPSPDQQLTVSGSVQLQSVEWQTTSVHNSTRWLQSLRLTVPASRAVLDPAVEFEATGLDLTFYGSFNFQLALAANSSAITFQGNVSLHVATGPLGLRLAMNADVDRRRTKQIAEALGDLLAGHFMNRYNGSFIGSLFKSVFRPRSSSFLDAQILLFMRQLAVSHTDIKDDRLLAQCLAASNSLAKLTTGPFAQLTDALLRYSMGPIIIPALNKFLQSSSRRLEPWIPPAQPEVVASTVVLIYVLTAAVVSIVFGLIVRVRHYEFARSSSETRTLIGGQNGDQTFSLCKTEPSWVAFGYPFLLILNAGAYVTGLISSGFDVYIVAVDVIHNNCEAIRVLRMFLFAPSTRKLLSSIGFGGWLYIFDGLVLTVAIPFVILFSLLLVWIYGEFAMKQSNRRRTLLLWVLITVSPIILITTFSLFQADSAFRINLDLGSNYKVIIGSLPRFGFVNGVISLIMVLVNVQLFLYFVMTRTPVESSRKIVTSTSATWLARLLAIVSATLTCFGFFYSFIARVSFGFILGQLFAAVGHPLDQSVSAIQSLWNSFLPFCSRGGHAEIAVDAPCQFEDWRWFFAALATLFAFIIPLVASGSVCLFSLYSSVGNGVPNWLRHLSLYSVACSSAGVYGLASLSVFYLFEAISTSPYTMGTCFNAFGQSNCNQLIQPKMPAYSAIFLLTGSFCLHVGLYVIVGGSLVGR